MEQLTLEQAAERYISDNGTRSHTRSAFMAGANHKEALSKEMIDELKANHEFLLQLYSSINTYGGAWNIFQDIQQALRNRMAKQLQLIDKATK